MSTAGAAPTRTTYRLQQPLRSRRLRRNERHCIAARPFQPDAGTDPEVAIAARVREGSGEHFTAFEPHLPAAHCAVILHVRDVADAAHRVSVRHSRGRTQPNVLRTHRERLRATAESMRKIAGD